MVNEQRLIDVNEAIEKINCLCVDDNENWIGTANQSFVDHADVIDILSDMPTVDAVEVDVVAQMLFDAFGDACPCNYNGNDEWLPFVCDGNECVKHNDPLYCWKQYIKHYGERKGDGDGN